MPRHLVGDGPGFELEWGGRTWGLRVDDRRPGLRALDGVVGPRLSLVGIAAAGRSALGALSGATLVDCSCLHGRVEATYAPLGWGGLFVRAAWSPFGDDGVDLEVQAHALSVGELRRLEVLVSRPPTDLAPEGMRYLELVRPGDLGRESREGDCYTLLGHDLERGVVLRARLRGLWLPAEGFEAEAGARLRQFLDEPPPLGP
jgi:hypothetical protein